LNPYMPDDAGKNEENPLNEKLIIVDEMSMVDTDLIYHLLKAVKSGAKLILSGDPDQLESVGCGAVLRDMIDSDVIPKVKLKKIMRQGEGSAVIDNCGKVLAGKSNFIENESFVVRTCKSEEEARAYLKSRYHGDPHNTQILSTTKKGVVGTMALNKEFEDVEQPGIWFHGDHFKIYYRDEEGLYMIGTKAQDLVRADDTNDTGANKYEPGKMQGIGIKWFGKVYSR